MQFPLHMTIFMSPQLLNVKRNNSWTSMTCIPLKFDWNCLRTALNFLPAMPYPYKLKLFWLSSSLLWQISRLIYIISSNPILALASNVIHLLWKWQRNARNSSGKVWECEITFVSLLLFASHRNGIETILFSDVYTIFMQATASVPPQLWQPSTNDINDSNTGDASPMFHSFQKWFLRNVCIGWKDFSVQYDDF
jgi:hypothetical protein